MHPEDRNEDTITGNTSVRQMLDLRIKLQQFSFLPSPLPPTIQAIKKSQQAERDEAFWKKQDLKNQDQHGSWDTQHEQKSGPMTQKANLFYCSEWGDTRNP